MFAPKMFGVCLRYSVNSSEAEDNLQEGFIKVFSNIKSFRHAGSFEGWVRRIMVNVALEQYRKQHLMHPVEDIGIYESVKYSDEILEKIAANELIEHLKEVEGVSSVEAAGSLRRWRENVGDVDLLVNYSFCVYRYRYVGAGEDRLAHVYADS